MSNLDSFSLLQCTDIGSGASVPGEKKKKEREGQHTRRAHKTRLPHGGSEIYVIILAPWAGFYIHQLAVCGCLFSHAIG